MASSTSNLDLISSSQASKEVTANALFDASSVSALFGRRASTTAALTWGYYGGVVTVSGTPTAVANGTLALTANLVNYIEYNRTTGALASNTAGWTATYDRVYAVTCGASTITSYVDWRFQGIGAPIAAYPMTYIGTWNASTNTPTLAGGTGTKGYLYKVSVSGTQDLGNGSTLFTANDSVVYNGATWDKLEGGITSAEVVAALGFTPENIANKNAASGYVGKDANSNAAANSLLAGYATTTTAAGTTTLTVASAQQQFFTGTTTQTVVMPLLSALVDGQSWKIDNDSTGAVTVNANATDAGTATQLPVVLAGGSYAFVTRTSATTWDVAGLSADTHAASSKTPPVDADELPLADSATSFSLKKLTWANLKAAFINTANLWTAAQSFPSGTVSAPGITLSTDTTTGLYRIGANNDGYAVSGAKVLDIASTGLVVTGTVSATGGASASQLKITSAVSNDYASVLQFGTNGTNGYAYINGPNGSTYGTYSVVLTRSDGTSPVIPLSLSSTGLAVTGTVNISGTAASTTGGQLNLGSTTQSTIGANGAATALTANPLGYLVAYVGTTKVIIPYYNA